MAKPDLPDPYGWGQKEVRRRANLSKPYLAFKSKPTAADIPKILKIDSTLRHNYGSDFKLASKGKGMMTLSGVKSSILEQARDSWKEAQTYKKAGGEGVMKKIETTGKSNDTKSAKAYIKATEGMSKKQLIKHLDDGDSSKKQLLRRHKIDLADAKKTLGKQGNAQAKTANVPKGGNRSIGGKSISKIASEMKSRGKEGWVTIGGAKINLGGE